MAYRAGPSSHPQCHTSTRDLQTNHRPTTQKTRKTPPTRPHKRGGWQPQHTTYTTQPINPDLDTEATSTHETTHHPTNSTKVLIHSPTGRLIATMTKSRLQKLRNLYRPNNENKPLPKVIAELILRQKAKAYDTTPIKAHPYINKNANKPIKNRMAHG